MINVPHHGNLCSIMNMIHKHHALHFYPSPFFSIMFPFALPSPTWGIWLLFYKSLDKVFVLIAQIVLRHIMAFISLP